jgi:hypothetical protein
MTELSDKEKSLAREMVGIVIENDKLRAQIATALALRVKPWITYTAADGYLSGRSKTADEIADEYRRALTDPVTETP